MRARPTAVVALVLALGAALPGCRVTERISEGAYRHAVADGAAAELRRRGFPMEGPPSCSLDVSAKVVRVSCRGRTADGRAVAVAGTATEADTDRPRERYVISVAGRPVLRTTCLDHGCGHQ